MEKRCRMCGELFTPSNPRQQDCNKPITRTCVICGKSFSATCSKNDTSQTCSKECSKKFATQRRKQSFRSQKRVCKLCGKEFTPTTNTQVVCNGEHFNECVVCGSKFKINYKPGSDSIRKTCSEECRRKLFSINNPMKSKEALQKRSATMVEKYGVEYAAQSEELQSKARSTMQERYGVEYAMQSDELRDKITATNRKRYGVDWAMQSDSVREKAVQTLQDNYQVDNPMHIEGVAEKIASNYEGKTGYKYPMQNPEVKGKAKLTNIAKYGTEFYSQTEEFKEKFKQISQERFGTSNPMQNKEVRDKAAATCLDKYGATSYLGSEEGIINSKKRLEELYGVNHYSKTPEFKARMLKYCTNLDEWVQFTEDCESYIRKNYTDSPTYKQLATDLGVSVPTVCDFVCTHGDARNLVKRTLSYMEEEIENLLKELNVEYIVHDRNSINPLELDFYLPQHRIGIECNPTSTHNCSLPYRDIEGNTMTYGYHKKKTDLCEKENIFLFHIFGYEWANNRLIIESMIRNLVGKCDNVIYARKCQVKEVSWKDAREFLDSNHRQGNANSKIRLGLYYEEELVSLMTFGKMRSTIGSGKENLDDCWELVRFCSKLNTSVVGGASKLFKHFVKTTDPARVRSFSDRAHTRGNLYATLNFEEVRRSDPGYVWVDLATETAYHRANAQKQNICKFLNDPEIDLSKSESQIMVEHGYAMVPDSGTITWEWKNN